MHVWTVEFAAAAERDFELIFDHLVQVYIDFGDDIDVAFERAEQRLHAIQSFDLDLAKIPYQGTLRSDIQEGLRFVQHDKALFWFMVYEDRQVVQVLAIFFGGQDHIRHMLSRLFADRSK